MRLVIRECGLALDQERRNSIERRLRFLLARFSPRIGRIVVRLADLSYNIGNLKVHCQIAIRLAPFGHVSIDVAAVDLDTALNWAASRIGPAVNRELMRWRDK
ncbi:MAG TPA: hypothetical protein VE988_02640 [Gemmataceae bacterium]|nr:hypothetical protein [Gemmataceae bacterium]